MKFARKLSLKRIALITMALSLIALALIGCAGTTTTTPGATTTAPSGSTTATPTTTAGEPLELTIWLAGTGDPVYDTAFRASMDRYTAENTNVSYELTFIPWGEYFTKLNTGLAGAAGPDVFMTGYGQLGTIIANDYLLQLDDYVPENWDGWTDIYENILNIGKVDGKLYAMLTPSTRVLLYRKDIAAQQGVTEAELVLKTPDDLYNLIRKMAVFDDKKNLVMSGIDISTGSTSWSPEQQFLINLTHHTAKIADARLWNEDLTAAFNTPEGIATMQTLYDLYKEGIALQSDPSDATFGIIKGIASMAWAPESSYTQADAAFPGQIGVIKSELGTMLIGNFMVVNKATKNPVEAAGLMLEMFSAESGKIFAEGLGQFPARHSLDAWYVEAFPHFENVVLAYGKSVPLSYTLTPKYTNLITIFRKASEQIFAGADIAQTLAQAETDWNNLLKE